jgi:anti-sigma factor RsiW
MTACTIVRRLITPYVDREASPPDQALVEHHIALCAGCRAQMEAEAAVRNLVSGRMAEARRLGVEPSCRPRSFALGRRVLYPRHAVMAACGAGVLAVVLLRPAAPAALVATGVIADSTCGRSHEKFTASFRIHISDRRCVLGCVERGAEFVLVTDRTIYRLQNQAMPELAQLAAERVQIKGTVKDGVIDVSSIVGLTAEVPRAPRSLRVRLDSRH